MRSEAIVRAVRSAEERLSAMVVETHDRVMSADGLERPALIGQLLREGGALLATQTIRAALEAAAAAEERRDAAERRG